MKTKHTPTPWHVEGNKIWQGEDVRVCEVITTAKPEDYVNGASEANARLIVRAVNAYEVGSRISFADDDLGRYKRELDNLSDIDPLDFIERSKALIARLEAAERLISRTPLMPETKAEYEAWRKAAGK